MRFFLEIAYKGTAYHGWQIQKNAHTVQEMLNKTLSVILTHEVHTTGSGRTDAGVHALQQFVQLDSHQDLQEETFKYKLNKMLPRDISVISIRKVKDDANARFDAISRSYEYRIVTSKNPFLEGLCYHFSKPLDLDLMNEAAALLLEHDNFESFSRVKTDVKTFICKINRAEWVRINDIITFYVSADRFLRGMVRAMAGTLLEVGLQRCTVNEFDEIIRSRDRKKAGVTAPAQGLFFSRIEYPDNIFIN